MWLCLVLALVLAADCKPQHANFAVQAAGGPTTLQQQQQQQQQQRCCYQQRTTTRPPNNNCCVRSPQRPPTHPPPPPPPQPQPQRRCCEPQQVPRPLSANCCNQQSQQVRQTSTFKSWSIMSPPQVVPNYGSESSISMSHNVEYKKTDAEESLKIDYNNGRCIVHLDKIVENGRPLGMDERTKATIRSFADRLNAWHNGMRSGLSAGGQNNGNYWQAEPAVPSCPCSAEACGHSAAQQQQLPQRQYQQQHQQQPQQYQHQQQQQQQQHQYQQQYQQQNQQQYQHAQHQNAYHPHQHQYPVQQQVYSQNSLQVKPPTQVGWQQPPSTQLHAQNTRAMHHYEFVQNNGRCMLRNGVVTEDGREIVLDAHQSSRLEHFKREFDAYANALQQKMLSTGQHVQQPMPSPPQAPCLCSAAACGGLQ